MVPILFDLDRSEHAIGFAALALFLVLVPDAMGDLPLGASA